MVLCRPRPPTYYGFKKAHAEGDQRFGDVTTADRMRQFGAGRQADTKDGMEMQDVKHSPIGTGFLGPVALRAHATASANASQPAGEEVVVN